MKAQSEIAPILGFFILLSVLIFLAPYINQAIGSISCIEYKNRISDLQNKLLQCESEKSKNYQDYQDCLTRNKELLEQLKNCKNELNLTQQSLSSCNIEKQNCINELNQYKNNIYNFTDVLNIKLISPINQKIITVNNLIFAFIIPLSIDLVLSIIIHRNKGKIGFEIRLPFELIIYVVIGIVFAFLLLTL